MDALDVHDICTATAHGRGERGREAEVALTRPAPAPRHCESLTRFEVVGIRRRVRREHHRAHAGRGKAPGDFFYVCFDATRVRKRVRGDERN